MLGLGAAGAAGCDGAPLSLTLALAWLVGCVVLGVLGAGLTHALQTRVARRRLAAGTRLHDGHRHAWTFSSAEETNRQVRHIFVCHGCGDREIRVAADLGGTLSPPAPAPAPSGAAASPGAAAAAGERE